MVKRSRAAARRGRLRTVDTLTLGAVALVVLLVSLPRLRDLALRENEGDAVWLTQRLGELCVEGGPAAAQALIARSPALERVLSDVEFLREGRLLRRHGYLFEVGGSDAAKDGGCAVRAWPWQHGRTGRVALVWSSHGRLLGHPNAEGRWSGPDRPPPAPPVGAGWRGVRRR